MRTESGETVLPPADRAGPGRLSSVTEMRRRRSLEENKWKGKDFKVSAE